jgi:flagellar motor switch/type III secretory pathway protein FliN
MNGSNQACQATPTQIIRETFLDSNRAKSEGEWWAASTIGELEEKHKRAWDKLEALETENAELKRQLSESVAYADKLAAGLPMLPKDVEIINQANVSLDAEVGELKRQIGELKELVGMKSGTIELWKEENAEPCKQLHRQGSEYTEACHDLAVQRDELKAENIRIIKLRDHVFAKLAELDELKRQVAEGELIPYQVILECDNDLKEFAQRKAAQ